MKIESSPSTCSFDQLNDMVGKKPGNQRLLDYTIGAGHVEIHNLGKGLQARCWSCTINEQLELFGGNNLQNNPAYFTLAFFLQTKGFRFATGSVCLAENISWDSIFFSDRSVCKIIISPGMKVDCLTISFSKQWFERNVVSRTTSFEKIKETVYHAAGFPLLGSMSSSEKKLVTRLLEVSGKHLLGSLDIKCGVLKIVSDFFLKLKERNSITAGYSSVEDSITKIGEYLASRLGGRLPKVKELEAQFAISGPTLKRYFRKKFGENLSTYFVRKKLEYARQLIEEQHADIKEAATALGYRNLHHFQAIYYKYCSSLLPAGLGNTPRS